MQYAYFQLTLLCVTVFKIEDHTTNQSVNVTKPPHIVFFLVDDWGNFDINLNGMRSIPTKNINRLAREGVYLRDYYVPPVCTPSRACLMTGLYDSNTEMQHRAITDSQPAGLPLRFKILPQWLNKKGYVSRIVGKWHLGYYKKAFTPTHRGFQSHYGFWNGFVDMFNRHSVEEHVPASQFLNLTNDYSRDPNNEGNVLLDGYDFRENMEVAQSPNEEYLTDILTSKAVEIIKTHNVSEPLFLYLAHHGVHRGNMQFEMRAPYKYTRYFDHIQDRERKQYAGALTAIDISLGRVIASLESQNMLKNSIVVVAADNGAPFPKGLFSNGGSNFPFRGYKMTPFEGGSRVPAFIWSPLINKPRTIFNGLMHVSDWLPTFYAAAGGNVHDLGNINGINLWDSITKGKDSPRTELLVQYDEIVEESGFRWKNFKLITGLKSIGKYSGTSSLPDGEHNAPEKICSPTDSNLVDEVMDRFYRNLDKDSIPYAIFDKLQCSKPKTDDVYQCTERNEYCLFNLKEDPCESNNVAHEYPEVVKTMMAKLRALMDLSAPAQNPPSTYLCNPRFYDGIWVNYGEINIQRKPNCSV